MMDAVKGFPSRITVQAVLASSVAQPDRNRLAGNTTSSAVSSSSQGEANQRRHWHRLGAILSKIKIGKNAQ